MDIGRYLRTVRDHHLESRTYSLDPSAMEIFVMVDEELKKIDEIAKNGYST